ncbi:protein of unknown function, might be related with Short chain dehydrogenase [Moritella yayanosii]|uniref:Uncharacterized protein n=1 Tax=Moritella yayanosii TaxID=69539 RepID=A0A330LLJ6_9GAMM|nr:protein of unknown function, might be related with Short chain dehydrogenase [Moritella yayanosii]
MICPDFVVTETHKRAIGTDGKPLGATPMQESKLMTAEQCAQLCLYASITGRWLRVDANATIADIVKTICNELQEFEQG